MCIGILVPMSKERGLLRRLDPVSDSKPENQFAVELIEGYERSDPLSTSFGFMYTGSGKSKDLLRRLVSSFDDDRSGINQLRLLSITYL
ncbi:hypothetical protein V1477_002825 [Vespula maculifrons]|uniref:Uncharacterized protein n=1 Tax=Vespula maculifrons TaxID=7453 RepID=A0ABD2CW42_VESMC